MNFKLNVIFTDEFSKREQVEVMKVYYNIQDILKTMGIMDEPDYKIYVYKTIPELHTKDPEIPIEILNDLELEETPFVTKYNLTFLKMGVMRFEEMVGLDEATHFLLFKKEHPSFNLQNKLQEIQDELYKEGFDKDKLKWFEFVGEGINHFFVWEHIVDNGGKKWLIRAKNPKIFCTLIGKSEDEIFNDVEKLYAIVEPWIQGYITLDLMGSEDPEKWGQGCPKLFALYNKLKEPFLSLKEFKSVEATEDELFQLSTIAKSVLDVLRKEFYQNDDEFSSIFAEID